MTDQSRYEGDITTLKPINEATDAYEAAGIWWAKGILSITFDTAANTQRLADAEEHASVRSVMDMRDVEKYIGGFAEAVAELSRVGVIDEVHVDYGVGPASVLLRAAVLADMPVTEKYTFPWKSESHIEDNVLHARLGATGTLAQVWPPAA